jgi:hypothetical protein
MQSTKTPPSPGVGKGEAPERACAAIPSDEIVLGKLRSDERVKVVNQMPRMLLIECSDEVASEWIAKLEGWKIQKEQRATMPDPKPKLKRSKKN